MLSGWFGGGTPASGEPSEPLEAIIARTEGVSDLPLPKYGNPGDVGMDLPVSESVTIPPHSGMDVHTGVYVVPPDRHYFRVVGKGSSAKRGLFFTLEIIDPEYRGEIILHPFNASAVPVFVERGKSIAQLELVKITRWKWAKRQIHELSKTVRGAGRMDSTKTGI